MAATESLMKMVVHCIDKIKSFRLGKEVTRPSWYFTEKLYSAIDMILLYAFLIERFAAIWSSQSSLLI